MSMPLSARSARDTGGATILAPGGAPLSARRRPLNPLLVKDIVGRPKTSCYDLPEDAFSYGRPGQYDAEGAHEVSMNWVAHAPSRRPHVDPSFDYRSFNKKAVGAKVTDSKGTKAFRREQDDGRTCIVRQTSRRHNRSQSPLRKVIPSDIVEGFTYGQKVRPSTPIREVISYRWAEQSEKELYDFYTEFRESQEMERNQVRKIAFTKASRGHASTAKKLMMEHYAGDCKDMFKLSRFQHAKSKVDTFRGPNDVHLHGDNPLVKVKYDTMMAAAAKGGYVTPPKVKTPPPKITPMRETEPPSNDEFAVDPTQPLNEMTANEYTDEF